MLTTLLRPLAARWLAPVGRHIPVHPNVLSSLGLVVAAAAAAGFALGSFRWAAAGIALSGTFDLLDGATARARHQGGSKLGGFVDSAMDRVADSVLFLGIFLHYYLSDPVGHAGAVLAVLAASGSNIASYFKARSEVEGVTCNVGLVKRADRLMLLMVLGMLGPAWGVPVLSVLVFFSVHSMCARAVFVYRRLGVRG
ncbi:MAG: CDP-alcohol phosphatidyltransferase family protein [Gemmatimonadota bacterium]|nr:CDP-alcohol phosphatidyltransferase family protein [Gemmatimonadota bacterium]MDE2871012.1 CDP-alcohol phosphatidyltransferase family protein [Gemmatimonadota bacterium]